MSLAYISQQLSIYIGSFLFITGLLGNGINILIFISERSYRRTPCTFYFLIGSIYNLAFIIPTSPTRILSAGFGMDFIRTSDVFCKIRQFCLLVFNIISISCSCLATIDQFLATSRKSSIRNLSQIKWAYRLVIIVQIIWYLQGIPVLLYQNISPITNSCIVTNPQYSTYIPIFLLGFMCIIPISIMCLFTWLTYRNIHQAIALVEQHIDRQLVRMTFMQVVLVILSFLPYGIYNAYTYITVNVTKDSNRRAIESLTSTIVSLIVTLFNTVCSFWTIYSIIMKIYS